MLDIEIITKDCIKWIHDFFLKNGPTCNAIVGISGGKDSTVVAKLCIEALGKERVIGIVMPNHVQSDLDEALQVCQFLQIRHYMVNIGSTVSSLRLRLMDSLNQPLSVQTEINMPARIRMATLYAIAQTFNGRVANTCNLSEDWVGYATRYGDAAGDFSPLSNLTVTEVKWMGTYLGLPDNMINKVPCDGLCGKTDEESLGFTYDVLDRYIRTGDCDEEIGLKIDKMHEKNLFKMNPMPSFYTDLPLFGNTTRSIVDLFNA